MISLEELQKLHNEVTGNAYRFVETKGHDYNNKQQKDGDTLFNLRVPSLLGICDDPVQTCLMNAANKVMRCSSLRTTDPAIKGESYQDSVEDAINYLIYSLAFYRENKKKHG
jgi:hypothetical protein